MPQCKHRDYSKVGHQPLNTSTSPAQAAAFGIHANPSSQDRTYGSMGRTRISLLRQCTVYVWKLSQTRLLRRKRKRSPHRREYYATRRPPTADGCGLYMLRRPTPPVLEMPATFNLELQPGRTVALDTVCASDDDLDMSRTEDGTRVDGNFWGVLKIVHEGDTHQVDFSGTRLTADIGKDYFLDQRTISKLLIATKPTTARCNLTIRCPAMQYVDLNISLANLWSWGVTYPQAEPVADGKVKVIPSCILRAQGRI